MQKEYGKKSKHHGLNGQNVKLVPVTEEHMDFICNEESDTSLWYYEESVLQDKELIRKKFIERINNDRVYDFIVYRSLSNIPVGIVYTWELDIKRRSWEIGYAILSEFQGNGYCKESLQLLIAFIFSELNAHKVVGMCHCENTRSAEVMIKAGMSKQGVFREEFYWHNKWVDQFYFSILESEFSLDNY